MAQKRIANFVQHKLTVAALAGDTTLTWDSVAGWPTLGDFVIRLDDPTLATSEYVLCTAVNVGLLQTTVVRAQEATSAAPFAINSTGGNDLTAQMMADAFVRLDTAVSQTLTGPLAIPVTLGGSPVATSYGSVPLKAAETLLGVAAASISWTSLPTTFRHARIEWTARGDTVAVSTNFNLRFNNDSAANYDIQTMQGAGAAASAAELLGQTSAFLGDMPAANATAAYAGVGSAFIAHYQGAIFNKQFVSDYGFFTANTTGTGTSKQVVGKWRTVATAVNRIDLIPAAGNFLAGSLFDLWLEP